MNNRLLTITRRMIPYVPELNPITGGVLATILMQQLDYWFEQKPDGFYKFMDPCDHPLYTEGDSWTENVGFTKNEFRGAFDSIGYRFSSKSEYMNAPDKFMGRMYASYVDRKSNLTFYFRNHALVDQRLNELVRSRNASQVTDSKAHPNSDSLGIPKANFTNPVMDSQQMRKPDVTDPNPDSLGVQKADVSHTISTPQGISILEVTHPVSAPQGNGFAHVPTTETTTEHTSINQLLLPEKSATVPAPESSSSILNKSEKPEKLYYPNILGRELKEIEKALEFCPEIHHQDVLDEIEGIRASGKIQRGAIPLAKALIKKVALGEFVLSAGVHVRAQREQRQANENAVRESMTPTMKVGPVDETVLAKLPANVARRILEAQARTQGVADVEEGA